MTAVIFFGMAAFSLHLIGYFLYARHIFHEKIKPNAATWIMWLIGGVVEWQTYDHMIGSHWSTSALPFACVLGLGAIFLATVYSQRREKLRGGQRTMYHKPELQDWTFVTFDVAALMIWLFFDMAEEANIVAVATTVVTFIPIWRTTWREPESEHPTMWLIWCLAYACMLAALLLGHSTNIWWQGFYPVYYFVLHFVVAILAFRAWKTTL